MLLSSLFLLISILQPTIATAEVQVQVTRILINDITMQNVINPPKKAVPSSVDSLSRELLGLQMNPSKFLQVFTKINPKSYKTRLPVKAHPLGRKAKNGIVKSYQNRKAFIK